MNPQRLLQIESLYHTALQLDESERVAFVRDSCPHDPELSAEVESLLAFEKCSEGFIEKNAIEVVAESLTQNRAKDLIGQNIGHYKIVAFLGAGGMGEVFCAVDERLGRRVALKLLSPMLVRDADYLRRFEREARTASALNHPNIMTIFEIGRTADTYFIATELIEGRTLRQRLLQNDLSLPEILKLSLQIAEALAAAHAAGIVHRDIKPENIMIRPDGYLKVLDFGLAKTVLSQSNDNGGSDLKSTVPGMIIGTPSYMSPEQVRGFEVDGRSDVFSLGVVTYEMISQKRPFAGETTSDIIAAILEREPEPLAKFAAGVPPELGRIVGRALTKDKESRYQGMSVFAADLKDLQAEIDFADSFDRRSRSSKMPASQNPLFFAGTKMRLAVTAILVVFTVALALYFFSFANRSLIGSVAVLPFVNSDNDSETEYLSDGLTESVINRLSQFSDFKVMSFNSVSRYKGTEFDAQMVGRDLKVQAVLISRMTQRGGDVSISTELVNAEDNSRIWGFQSSGKTSDILALQENVSKQISERLELTLSDAKNLARRDTQNAEAYRLYLKGRFFWNKRSAEGLRRGIEFFDQAIEQDPTYALAYAGLADCYGLLSNYTNTSSSESMPRAKAAALKALEFDDSLAEAHTSLGLVKKEYEWDFAGAEADFKRAIELNPNYATAHQWRAENLVTLKRFDEAIESMTRAQEVDPFSLIINGEMGWVLHHARRYDEAIEHLRKALELDRNFVRTHFFVGRVYEQKRMYREAIAATTRATELSNGNILFKASLAHIYANAGQKSEAEKILRELEDRAKIQYVSPFAFALVFAGMGEKREALSWLEKAFDQRDTILFNYIRDPQLDNLRDDPRFAALLDRVQLSP